MIFLIYKSNSFLKIRLTLANFASRYGITVDINKLKFKLNSVVELHSMSSLLSSSSGVFKTTAYIYALCVCSIKIQFYNQNGKSPRHSCLKNKKEKNWSCSVYTTVSFPTVDFYI